MDAAEDFLLVQEVAKDDPFYDKKETLLQSKGFSPKERVYIQNLSNANWMSTVNVMLQVARVIQLNELELYFAEEDANTLVEFYSPRNELEALNSLVSLIDRSLTSCEHFHVNLLQELRRTVIGLISDFGDKISVRAIVQSHCNCDKEKCLLEWGENNGVRTQLQVAYVKGAGRGAIASRDLQVGDVALEIPVSIIISEELVYKTDIYQALKEVDGISCETILLLWSMKEKHSHDSKFKIYFDTLPESFDTGLSFDIDGIAASEGTLLFEEIMQAKEHLRDQYNELVPALCNHFPDIFPPELYTWEQFLWACELWYTNSMKIMFSDGKLRTCLIPIAGFMNHSLCPHIMHYGKVDTATNSLKFRLSRPCRSGEECCLSYGNYSSSHLITFYGFLPHGDNPYDVIPLDIDADSIEDENKSGRMTHMVRGTWLSKNHSIFHYGLPSPLLDYLRRSRNPWLKTKTLLQENLENEVEVLEDLRQIFDDMLDNLGEIDCDDSIDSWGEKLAVDFKILQRRIASSISNSCRCGINVVKDELYKCMSEDTRG